MDLVDGLETGSPYLHLLSPDLAFSLGGSLHCSSSPLSESVLICSSFSSRRFILFLYPSGSRAEQSSPNRVPFKERHFSYSLEFWSQISAAGLKTDLRTVILTG